MSPLGFDSVNEIEEAGLSKYLKLSSRPSCFGPRTPRGTYNYMYMQLYVRVQHSINTRTSTLALVRQSVYFYYMYAKSPCSSLSGWIKHIPKAHLSRFNISSTTVIRFYHAAGRKLKSIWRGIICTCSLKCRCQKDTTYYMYVLSGVPKSQNGYFMSSG